MELSKAAFVDKTILNTPMPTACSTLDRRAVQRKKEYISNQISTADLENSLGILPLQEVDVSNISADKNTNSSVDISYNLHQQRVLANSSLQRANKVAGIPSKYLKPNINISSMSNLNMSVDSTISEIDLLKTPNVASTPRTSVTSNKSDEHNQSRLSLGQSMAELSYKIGNTDISIDNFVKEFQKAMKGLDNGNAPEVDSNIFKPAEEAASMLLADEISWRRQNDIPVPSNFSQITTSDAPTDISLGKMSVGEFFQQRSDTLSNFQTAVSPTKPKPTPLIDTSDTSVKFSEASEDNNQIQKNTNKSLSITAIQKFLAETEDTPKKVTNYLFFQGKKLDKSIIDNFSLPVSKDSSYSSNYSDNDVMKCIVADKENMNISNILQKKQLIKTDPKETTSESENRPLSTSSRSTSRTSSALTSLPNGKLPIESTKVELIWGSVKVDKCITQDFLIRNKTPKRLGLQMTIAGHEFKIRKDSRQDSDPLSTSKIILHPYESKAVIISFIPTKIGAAVDEIIFTSLDPNLQQIKKQCVKLFGYGGYGRIELHNLTKDTTGKFWLPLGKLDDRNVITKRFIIQNTGTLPSFAYISFNCKELFAFANVTVVPNFLILIPNEQKEVEVMYTPTAEDHKRQSLFNNTMVTDIGNLLVISGTEVNRGRLRRLCRKCSEKGLTVDSMSSVLRETVKNEIMPPDLVMFKESPGSLKEILTLFNRREIVLTLEQDPEQTLMPQYPDESAMFHSLYQDSTVVGLENTRIEASCKLEPANVILIPPTKIRDSLLLISETEKTLHFEVACSPEGLEISPKEGIIRPRQEVILNVTCPKLPTNEKRLFKVLVYVENEVFEASVKVTFISKEVNAKEN